MKFDEHWKSMREKSDEPVVARIVPPNHEEDIRKLQEIQQQKIERDAQREAAILRTADEAEAQTELLKDQLEKAKERNELLQKSCSELEKANEQLNEEAAANRIEREKSRKEAKKARRLTVAAFVLSIVFPIASIVASVLIALYVK